MTITNEYQSELMRQHASKDGWGTTASKYTGGEVLQQLFHNGQIQDVLDYGCGKQALRPFIAKFFPNIRYVGYDPGVPGAASNLVKGKRYGLVVNIDVLEHVEKEKVEDVLRELGEFTKYTLLLDIACYPTGKLFESGPYAGEDIHINICPPEAWAQLVRKVLGDEFYVAKYSPSYLYPMNGIERPRCLMILNRKY